MDAKLAPKDLTMEEAVQYWEDKVKVSKEEWDKLPAEARTKAFFVSGLASEQMQADVFGALQKAIKNGTTFAQFKKDIRGTLDAAGWTAESMWRLRTIFVTNMLTAYSVGRYKQMTDAAILETRPFWQYDAVDDGRTRPAHRALDGKVLRADDPAWDEIYPPNGFNCRCTVRTLNAEDVKRMGLSVQVGSDVVGQPAEVEGRTVVVRPDEGFAHNPGKTQFGAPPRIEGRKEKVVEILGETAGGRTPLPADGDTYDRLKEGASGDQVRQAWGEMLGQEPPVQKDVMGQPVRVDSEMLDYVLEKGSAESGADRRRGEHIRAVLPAIRTPAEVWLQPERLDSGRIRLRKVYLKHFVQGHVTVLVEATGGEWVGFNTYPTRSPQGKRKGFRIYERPSLRTPQSSGDNPDGSATEAHRQGSTPSYAQGMGGQA